MPDDHSKLVPLLPIPNRTVKRLSADDSAGSRVKVGHRQAVTASETPTLMSGGFCSQALYLRVEMFGDFLDEKSPNICKVALSCAILQGFADRGEVAQEVEWFFKNIQPINVGV